MMNLCDLPLSLIAAGEMPGVVLLIGVLSLAALTFNRLFERFSLPPIVGYLLIGILLTAFNKQVSIVGENGETVLSFLSMVGVVVLLFRVGIESDLHALLKELPKASAIWLPNLVLSGGLAYWVTRHLLGYELIPSLFVGVAMTATSIGVAVAVWEETGSIKRSEGGVLLDTAELDDISGVALMGLLFGIVPILRESGTGDVAQLGGKLATETGLFLLRFGAFVVVILLLGRFLEAPLARCAKKTEHKATILIVVVALGFTIAGTAGLAGLSLPVGALFAGLLLSSHRESYGVEPFYQSLYLFFVPFFFIHIGYLIEPSFLVASFGIGMVLVLVAILGKIVGSTPLAWCFTGFYGALLIGVSMVPRAEIAMVVIERGRQLGDWAMPDDLYAAMVLVSAMTCLGTSLFLHWALRRW
ncbi:MAG: cation:proton antiporter [Opitutales bacterium]